MFLPHPNTWFFGYGGRGTRQPQERKKQAVSTIKKGQKRTMSKNRSKKIPKTKSNKVKRVEGEHDYQNKKKKIRKYLSKM